MSIGKPDPITDYNPDHAFAALMGVSIRTLQEWEQGRRKPSGLAAALLRVASRHPEALLG